MKKVHSKVESKNVCRLCRSCRQTSPVFSSSTQRISTKWTYEPIAFNDNLSFYFNSLNSVQDVLKESHHSRIMVISTWFLTHLEIFDTVFNMPLNFQHGFQYALKFSTQFSICLKFLTWFLTQFLTCFITMVNFKTVLFIFFIPLMQGVI